MVGSNTKPVIVERIFHGRTEKPWPGEVGSVGWNLCQMVGCSEWEFIQGFERFIIDHKVRKLIQFIWGELEGRKIIFLGWAALKPFGLPFEGWILPQLDVTGREWRVIPNTGMEEKAYRNPLMKLEVSLLLKDWFNGY